MLVSANIELAHEVVSLIQPLSTNIFTLRRPSAAQQSTTTAVTTHANRCSQYSVRLQCEHCDHAASVCTMFKYTKLAMLHFDLLNLNVPKIARICSC
jgi:hypothetical protein